MIRPKQHNSAKIYICRRWWQGDLSTASEVAPDTPHRVGARKGRVGVWVSRPNLPRSADGTLRDDKIAAIGVKLRKWVSFHGLSINVDPDLAHFTGIVPCGIKEHGITSLVDLGLPVSMSDLDSSLMRNFAQILHENRAK